jgi:hypothetical protein
VGDLKKYMSSGFAAEADVEQAVIPWLQILDTDLFCAELEPLVPRREKFLNINGDYVEVWCVPSATHVPCILEVGMEFSTSRAFV